MNPRESSSQKHSTSYADVVRGPKNDGASYSTSWLRTYQQESEEEAIRIAMAMSKEVNVDSIF
jgi:hypothetical protein